MEDREIVELYWARDQRAVGETEGKYGPYMTRVAENVLGRGEDVPECVNDTLLAAWNSMPPHRPAVLRTFLGKLARRLSLNRLRGRLRYKRGGGEAEAAIDELAEALPSGSDTEGEVELRELTLALDEFLDGLTERERGIFMRRYWYFDPMADIAAAAGVTEGAVKSSLHRTRVKLRTFLEKEEWI